MGENTKIEWADHTFNPWIGCSKVSPACDFCYAEAMMDHRYGKASWGAGEDRVRTSPANWRQPLKWNRDAERAGKRATVFCLSLGDIWDNEVDPMWRSDLMRLIESTPWLTYLLLSKRIGNAVKMCDVDAGNWPLPINAALGSTMVNQAEWDRDLPKLKEAGERLGACFTFASAEPMLGPIQTRGDLPDWVIVGGESGPNARPMHPDWVRGLRDQCGAAEVPFFFKQWGEWWAQECNPIEHQHFADRLKHAGFSQPNLSRPQRGCWDARGEWRPGSIAGGPGAWTMWKLGKKAAGAMLDGREWREFPA